ncbi:MAG: reverse transcriptase domain-containing protein [Pseudomonadota bacterium]
MVQLSNHPIPRNESEALALQSAALKQHRKQLRRIKRAYDNKNWPAVRHAVRAFLNHFANKYVAAEQILRCSDFYPSEDGDWDGVYRLASMINVFETNDEEVQIRSKLKGNGTRRYYCDFGCLNKSRQLLVKFVVDELHEPNPLTFGVRGQGISSMTELITCALRDGYGWAQVADVRDCFPSITQQHVSECFGWLPAACVNSVLLSAGYNYVVSGRDRRRLGRSASVVVGARRGIPQGSAVFNLVANAVINRIFSQEELSGSLVPRFADDFLLLAKTREELSVNALMLENVFRREEAGPLQLRFDEVRRVDHGFWHLKRHFKHRYEEWSMVSPISVRMPAGKILAVIEDVEASLACGRPSGQEYRRLLNRVHGLFGAYKGINFLATIHHELVASIKGARASQVRTRRVLSGFTRDELLPLAIAPAR